MIFAKFGNDAIISNIVIITSKIGRNYLNQSS